MTENEAIKMLKSKMDGHTDTSYEWAETVRMAIKALEQTRWIPCTERLPKNDDDVLVCNSQGVMEVCYYHIDDTFYPTEYADLNETGWFNENDDALYFEPVVWMPLPEPYKAESEDKK